VPDGEDARLYHETLGSPDYPVLSDQAQTMLNSVPYDGSRLPGKCVLSPEMELLHCAEGHGTGELLTTIVEHAAAR